MEVNSVFFSVARIMQTPVHEGFIQTQTSSIVLQQSSFTKLKSKE